MSLESEIDGVIEKLNAIKQKAKQSTASINSDLFTKCVQNINGAVDELEKYVNDRISGAVNNNNGQNGKVKTNMACCLN